uniref:glutathione S-transferase theta-3-like n=1 Tax=Pristiophorus japonicus TaxID=55135 RepID=UPI00398EC386
MVDAYHEEISQHVFQHDPELTRLSKMSQVGNDSRHILALSKNMCIEALSGIYVLLSAGQQYSEEFGKVNSLRLVPALKDGDFTLAESVAILKYLASKYQTPDHWYPADLHKRARVDEYLAWQHMTIRFKGSRIFIFKTLLPFITGQPIPKDRMDEALEDLQSSIQSFEEKFLQDRPYIVGHQVSVADLVAVVELMQPLVAGIDPFDGRPKLIEWCERVKGAVGKELFDEAHEKSLKNKDTISALDRNSPALKQLAKKLQQTYK